MNTLLRHIMTAGSAILGIGRAILGGVIFIFLKLSSLFGQLLFWLEEMIYRPALKEEDVWYGKAFLERRSQERSKVDLPCVVSGLWHGQLIHENARVMNINQRCMYIEAKTLFDEGSEIKAQLKTNPFSRTPFNGGSEMIAQIKAMRFGKTFWVMGKVLRSTTRGMAVGFADLVQGGSKVILNAR